MSQNDDKGKIVTKICEYCGKPYEVPWHKAVRRTYCSSECTRKAVRMDIIPGKRPPGFRK